MIVNEMLPRGDLPGGARPDPYSKRKVQDLEYLMDMLSSLENAVKTCLNPKPSGDDINLKEKRV